jgi:hypothetical protein
LNVGGKFEYDYDTRFFAISHAVGYPVDRSHGKTLMTRIVKQLLFASLIACHAAAVLCGPCLHELPGSTHQMGAVPSSHRADNPLQSQSDSKDGCLICHFVAQGQLPIEFFRGTSPQLITELVVPARPVALAPSDPLPSCPRAPPAVVIAG